MNRYTQSENFRIVGPGLPAQGVVSVGPGELEKAFEAGRWYQMDCVFHARKLERRREKYAESKAKSLGGQ